MVKLSSYYPPNLRSEFLNQLATLCASDKNIRSMKSDGGFFWRQPYILALISGSKSEKECAEVSSGEDYHAVALASSISSVTLDQPVCFQSFF
jgi:hypothetical protein